ncbi:MAG: cysteine desulfurase [Hyphomonadaceae bacterium]|nr:cysteine desulfurase [Hyphomonadaceae bacterium]
MTYCDYNAGAPIRAEAAVAVARALALGGNASSVHGVGRRARALIEDAREQLAGATEASAENIVFTSGATEALHLALDGAGAASLIVSAVEHDAVFEHARRRSAVTATVTSDGLIDLAALDGTLRQAAKPALVALQLANNETGVVQPVAKVAALCREHGALLLVDAAQAFGKIPVSLPTLDASYLVVSSHKIGGPPGAGALILAPGAPYAMSRFGGGQERGRRPGTENMPAIAGFRAAIEQSMADLDDEAVRVAAMRGRLEDKLPAGAVVVGRQAPRLPNTSNFALPGVAAETAVIALDLEGVAVSSGAACSSGKVRSSRVLAAMGVDPQLARSALRISFGHASTEQDVDAVVAALHVVAARRRSLEGAGA